MKTTGKTTFAEQKTADAILETIASHDLDLTDDLYIIRTQDALAMCMEAARKALAIAGDLRGTTR